MQQRPDPTPRSLPSARGRDAPAIALFHGLTGTPWELRPLADALHAQGYAVELPCIAGHTDVDALERSTREDWLASARDAVTRLRERGHTDVAVVGFSMGSLLALKLCAEDPGLRAVVAICVPLQFEAGWHGPLIDTLARARRVPGLGRLIGMKPKHGGSDARSRAVSEGSPSLRAFPWPALSQMHALQGEVERALPQIRCPALVLHARDDHAAPVEASVRVAQRLGSDQVERVVYEHSFHQVALDLDGDRLRDDVVRFFARELPLADAPCTTVPS